MPRKTVRNECGHPEQRMHFPESLSDLKVHLARQDEEKRLRDIQWHRDELERLLNQGDHAPNIIKE